MGTPSVRYVWPIQVQRPNQQRDTWHWNWGPGLPLGGDLDMFTPMGEREGASTARSRACLEGPCTVAEMEPQRGGREAECVQGDVSDVTEMTGNVTAPWV